MILGQLYWKRPLLGRQRWCHMLGNDQHIPENTTYSKTQEYYQTCVRIFVCLGTVFWKKKKNLIVSLGTFCRYGAKKCINVYEQNPTCVCVCVYLRQWRWRSRAEPSCWPSYFYSAAAPVSSEWPCTWSRTKTSEGQNPPKDVNGTCAVAFLSMLYLIIN